MAANTDLVYSGVPVPKSGFFPLPFPQKRFFERFFFRECAGHVL